MNHFWETRKKEKEAIDEDAIDWDHEVRPRFPALGCISRLTAGPVILSWHVYPVSRHDSSGPVAPSMAMLGISKYAPRAPSGQTYGCATMVKCVRPRATERGNGIRNRRRDPREAKGGSRHSPSDRKEQADEPIHK